MSRFICDHGVDTDQISCGQCEVIGRKRNPTLNGHTPASAMTLREHFAAEAMKGFCACPNSWEEQNYEERAASARMQADALLAELAKVKP